MIEHFPSIGSQELPNVAPGGSRSFVACFTANIMSSDIQLVLVAPGPLAVDFGFSSSCVSKSFCRLT